MIDKCGYKESVQAGEGDILWYGLALRDHDIDVIRARNTVKVNRYPLMDVINILLIKDLDSTLPGKMFFASY